MPLRRKSFYVFFLQWFRIWLCLASGNCMAIGCLLMFVSIWFSIVGNFWMEPTKNRPDFLQQLLWTRILVGLKLNCRSKRVQRSLYPWAMGCFFPKFTDEWRDHYQPVWLLFFFRFCKREHCWDLVILHFGPSLTEILVDQRAFSQDRVSVPKDGASRASMWSPNLLGLTRR